MVTSGFVAQMSVAGMLLRPEPKSDEKSGVSEPNTKESNRDPFINQTKMIFSNSSYVLFTISTILSLFTAGIVFTHIVAYVESKGLNSNWSSAILTTLGGAMFGRWILHYETHD